MVKYCIDFSKNFIINEVYSAHLSEKIEWLDSLKMRDFLFENFKIIKNIEDNLNFKLILETLEAAIEKESKCALMWKFGIGYNFYSTDKKYYI